MNERLSLDVLLRTPNESHRLPIKNGEKQALKEIEAYFIRNRLVADGHLQPGEKLSGNILDALEKGQTLYARISKLCQAIKDARNEGTLTTEHRRDASYWGLSNFRKVRQPRADLRGSKLRNLDFTEADLTGVIVDKTEFTGSLLQRAIMPFVYIGNRRIDLEEDALRFEPSDLWEARGAHKHVPEISKTEGQFKMMLTTSHWDYRSAILARNNQPFAAVSLYDSAQCLLALRTVYYGEDAFFKKAMRYQLSPELSARLAEIAHRGSSKPVIVDVESLPRGIPFTLSSVGFLNKTESIAEFPEFIRKAQGIK